MILVCDLIQGSVAQEDGRLMKADQLVCIGEVDVTGQPVSYVVDMLKATGIGPVTLRIRHALHCSLLDDEEVRVTHPRDVLPSHTHTECCVVERLL